MSRLRSNKVVNQAGTGAPELTYGAVVPATGTISGAGGINVTGVITATSFSGDGSSLSGVSGPDSVPGITTTGTSTFNNINVTGVATAATLNVGGDATVTGNLTVNGTTTTIDTAVTAVDSLAVDGNITAGGNVSLPDSSSASDGRLRFGAGNDLQIYHDGNNSYISDSGTGGLILLSDGTLIETKFGGEHAIKCWKDGQVELYHDNSVRVATTADGVDISGTGSIKVPVGTTAQRNASPTAGDFRYNSTEGKFEGYTTEWGEIGGGGGGITTAAHVANNAVVTLDLTAAQDHKVTATGICTITCTGGTEATSHTIRIINSGSATVGFSTYFLFPSGNTPVLPSTDGAINLVSFTVNRVGAAGTQLLTGASLNFS